MLSTDVTLNVTLTRLPVRRSLAARVPNVTLARLNVTL